MLKIILVIVGLILLLDIFYNLNKSSILDSLYIDKSKIPNAGRGIFTIIPIKKGKFLFNTTINKKVTPPAAMVNHCINPNTYHIQKGNNWYLYSSRDIKENEELLINYNIAPSFTLPPEKHWKC